MKIFSAKYVPVWVLAMLALTGLMSGAKNSKISDADRAKASYIFMEAAGRIAENDYGTAYYMLRRANELNPADDEIAAELGKIILISGLGDSTEFENSYNALKRLFFNNPSDVQNGYAFIKIAQQLNRKNDVKAAYLKLMEAYPGNADFALNYAGYRTMDFLDGDTAGPADAVAIYDRLESGTGITDLLTLHRLHSLSVTRDTAEMMRQIGRFYASAPMNPHVNFLTGSMFDLVHIPDSAIVYYTAACILDSTYGEAYLAKAEHYLSIGDSARYDREVLHALESPSLEFEAKYEILSNYARSLYADEERRDLFLGLFKKMMDIHPGEASLHYLYGAYLGTIDSVAAASEQFGYAMDLDPEEDLFARYRIQTAVEAGDTAAAVAAARTASARFNNVFYPISGASLLQLSGHPAEAAELMRSFDISKADNDYQKSLYEQTLGDVLYAAEQKDSAYAAYDRALVYNPDNAGVLNNMAYFMALDNVDLDKAEKYVKRAIHFEPNNPTYVDTYAWVLFKQKDYPAARRQIDIALDMYDQYVDSVGGNDTVMVDELFEKVADDKLVEMVTGVVDGEELALEEQEVEEVVDVIEPVTPPAEIYDHAGDIYFMNGEPDTALKYWKEALLLDPENKKIKKKVDNRAYFFE